MVDLDSLTTEAFGINNYQVIVGVNVGEAVMITAH